jgi:hypothetical protein
MSITAVTPTSLIVAGELSTGVFVDGQPIGFLGGSTPQEHHPIAITAPTITEVWMSAGDGLWDVYQDKDSSFCPTTPDSDCRNGGFGSGLLHDGQTLWMTVGNGAGAGIWGAHPSGRPSTEQLLPLTLAVAGKYAAIVPGPSGTAWAVGPGSAARFDGTTWTAVPNKTTFQLEAAAVLPNGEVWAVGADGIAHYDGKNWSVPIESGLPHGGRRVAATDDGTVWITDQDGLLYRRTPGP